MWMTKKKLKEELAHAEEQLSRGSYLYHEVMTSYLDADKMLKCMKEKFPFELGQTVYQLELRNSKGRFTKTKASREHSTINEVVVDKKNYFTLVDKIASGDVFTTLEDAEKHIAEVCIE